MWAVLCCALAAAAARAHATPLFDEALYESVLDPELCATQLSEMSSFEFYDASFRVPQGILRGNLVHLGNYYQCLGISQEAEHGPIEGKYCTIRVPVDGDSVALLPGPWPDLPDLPWFPTSRLEKLSAQNGQVMRGVRLMAGIAEQSTSRDEDSDDLDIAGRLLGQFRLAVCIPKTCSVDQALGRYFNSSLLRVDYTTLHCRLPNDKPFAPVDYLAITIFSLIGLVTVLSTGYELRHVFLLQRDRKQLSQLGSCCSLYTNTRRLFTFSPAPGGLSCLDGIRSLSIMWVVLGHTILTMFLAHIYNLIEALLWYESADSLWLKAANISVDTFLMLSGLLLVYTSVKKMTPSALVRNLHLYYLNRLLRMFPLLAAAVLLQASLLHHVADGANWHVEAGYVARCRQDWWAALLHIQNYYNPQNECLPHTWYLAVDMQLYFLSPLVLFWALRGRRQGWAGISVALLTTLAASTTFIFIRDFATNMFSIGAMEYWKWYYVNILTRAPVFLIGMLVGFLLHDCRNRKVKLPAWAVVVGWVAALGTFSAVLYSYQPAELLQSQPGPVAAGLINSFSRSAWAAALGWLAFACVHGYGGPINWFLSLTLWKFMARISYAMYLFHYPLQFVTASAVLEPMHFSVPNGLINFVTDLSITVMVSVVVCILIDAPFSTLQRILLGGGAKKKPVHEARKPELAPANTGAPTDATKI